MKTKFFLMLISVLIVNNLASGAVKFSSGEAFGAPGIPGTWASARKVQVGTFHEPTSSAKSPLWFTLAEGTLTEVYYPTVDSAQIKDSQFLVSDGKTFFKQERDLKKETVVLSPSLVKIVNSDYSGRFKISHTYYTLKDSPVLIDEVEAQVNQDGISLFLLTKPQLNNTAAFDSAQVTSDGFFFKENLTQLRVNSSVGFRKKSVGFSGFSDGWQDLNRDYHMDYEFLSATNGSVASTGEIDIPQIAGTYKFYIVYSFANGAAVKKLTDYAQAKNDYVNEWNRYLSALRVPKNLTNDQTTLYLRSLYTLKCHEDKLNPGAFIASLSVPWGETQKESPGAEIGGYHLIWPRDLFNVSVALLNSGDYESALNALRFLKKVQYKPGAGSWNLNPRIIPKAGAWPQNTWVTGRTYWEGFQIDQTAFPIHLFYHLYLKTNVADRDALLNEFRPMLTSALDFISTYGPWTHQERWEENFGISPSSFSAAASALIVGSKIFKDGYGQKLQDTANHWLYTPNDNIDSWTFTTTGTYGDGQYYLRMAGGSSYDAPWNPNDRSSIHIANSSQKIQQDKVLDQGFLQLALLGLKPGSFSLLKKSKDIVDQQISVMTPKGRGWYRYSFDAYGEEGKGRLWPLLSGEHARFAIERFSANDMSWPDVLRETNSVLDSFLGFANDGMMIPEQVFEKTGEGTGSATPLAWAHAEYIKLLWSVEAKHNIENVLR
jgi:glucoamylase